MNDLGVNQVLLFKYTTLKNYSELTSPYKKGNIKECWSERGNQMNFRLTFSVKKFYFQNKETSNISKEYEHVNLPETTWLWAEIFKPETKLLKYEKTNIFST